MPEILALLQNVAPHIEKTTFHRMSQVVLGMLVASGRITMLGLSRWTEKGGSYRTLQRFYQSVLPWSTLHWLFIRKRFLKPDDEYLIAGDEVVVSKAGTKTYGLDRFFSGLQQQVIPGLSFFTFSLVNIQEAQSYPLQTTQMVKRAAEKAAGQAKARPVKKPGEKNKPGRPKGSKNKPKQAVVLNPELVRIQQALRTLVETVGTVLSLKYVALDGHFGNYPSAFMVRQANLHLISKLRSDAALYPAFAGDYRGRGPRPKYGAKLAVRQLAAPYLKETQTEGSLRTEIYQGQFYNKEFAFALNVVILLKTHVVTHAQAHVILFSTDLDLAYAQIISYYSLRFQIEFNFRDAKQFWGLEDFMNVKQTAVTNAANLSFFMVNFSYALLQPFRQTQPDFSVLDLKAQYRGYRYARETIKMLPQKPDAILLADLFQHLAQLGAIHPVFHPSASP
jgi:hypothetical protein